MKHSFLLSLEESKCVGEGTGWYTFHLVVKEEKDVAPALKRILIIA
jgi:predicted N-acyltransferase